MVGEKKQEGEIEWGGGGWFDEVVPPAVQKCEDDFHKHISDNMAIWEDSSPSSHYRPNYSRMSKQFPDNHRRY